MTSPTAAALRSGVLPLGVFPAVYCKRSSDGGATGFVVGWRWSGACGIPPSSRAFLRGYETDDALEFAASLAAGVLAKAPGGAELLITDAEWLAERNWFLEGGSFALAAFLGAIAWGTGARWPARTLAWGGLGISRSGTVVLPTALGNEKLQLAVELGAEHVICPAADAAGCRSPGLLLTLVPARPFAAAALAEAAWTRTGASHVR